MKLMFLFGSVQWNVKLNYGKLKRCYFKITTTLFNKLNHLLLPDSDKETIVQNLELWQSNAINTVVQLISNCRSSTPESHKTLWGEASRNALLERVSAKQSNENWKKLTSSLLVWSSLFESSEIIFSLNTVNQSRIIKCEFIQSLQRSTDAIQSLCLQRAGEDRGEGEEKSVWKCEERNCWDPQFQPIACEETRPKKTKSNHVKDRWSGDCMAACSVEVAG